MKILIHTTDFMPEDKSTPKEWAIEGKIFTGSQRIVSKQLGKLVALVDKKEDAELIVTAVNAYEEMKKEQSRLTKDQNKALNELLDCIDSFKPWDDYTWENYMILCMEVDNNRVEELERLRKEFFRSLIK